MKQTRKVLILLCICIFYDCVSIHSYPITQAQTVVVLSCRYYNRANSYDLDYVAPILTCIKALKFYFLF